MYKLILADDERIVRESIRTIIDWQAHDIELVGICKDGIETYNMILDECPDIVITDINMPGLSGLEMIKKIRNVDADVSFIIISGYQEFEYAKQAMRFGIQHYLIKPCNEAQILEAIEQLKQAISRTRSLQTLDVATRHLRTLTPETVQHLLTQCRQERYVHLENWLSSAPELDMVWPFAAKILVYAAEQMGMDSAQNIADVFRLDNKQDILLYIDDRITQWIDAGGQIHAYRECVQKTLQFIDEHLDDADLSLKRIAEKHLYLNPAYLSRQFYRETGEKFSGYLNRKRIERAKEMIRTRKYRMQDIAENVGCGNNPNYFSQVFRKYTGMSPSAYAQQLQE